MFFEQFYLILSHFALYNKAILRLLPAILRHATRITMPYTKKTGPRD
jgi:hypothetical protein